MDESKSMLDLRNKRLNYYNRILEANNENKTVLAHNETDTQNLKFVDNKRNSLPETLVTKEPLNYDSINSNNHILPENNEILDKLFGESLVKPTKNLYQSVSFDASSTTNSSTRSFTNPKLEEFKRVVEGSYAQHVLHKSDFIKQSNNTTILNQTYSKYDDIYSLNNTPRNNLIESSRASFNFHPELTINDIIPNEEIQTKITDNSNLPCKIPYMSAYNIYQPSGDTYRNELNKIESADNNDTTAKHLSSTGSSLTTSPTSVSSSSAGSIKKLNTNSDIELINDIIMSGLKVNNNNINNNQQFNSFPPSIIQSETEPLASSRLSTTSISNKQKPQIEAKPPETPRTISSANLTFRKKNLVMNQPKTSINQKSSTEISHENNTLISNDRTSFEKQTKLLENNNSRDEQREISFPIKQQPNVPESSNPIVNLYTRSNSINEQMIKDQFTWDNLFNRKQSNTSLNSSANFGKKKLEPIDRSNSKLNNYNISKSKNSTFDKLFNSNKNVNTFSIKKSNNFNNNNNKEKKNVNIKRKPNKNNIFNYNENENYLYDEEDDEDDDKCDTLDIFSSDEDDENQNVIDNVTIDNNNNNNNDYNNKNNDYASKFDLKIDLGQLSADEDNTLNNTFNKQKNLNNVAHEDEESYNLNEIINSCTNRTQQQIKPDHIPNLCLDLIEDDKSQSVAASLAKSMCKEINYKKEMEMIYNHNQKPIKFENDLIINPIPAQASNSINSKFSNKNSKSNNFDVNYKNNNYKPTSNSNINQGSADLTETNTFLKGPKLSSRQSSSRIINHNQQPLTSSRPQSSNFFHNKRVHNPTQIGDTNIVIAKRPNSVIELKSKDVRASTKKSLANKSTNILTSNSMVNIFNENITNKNQSDSLPPKEKNEKIFNKSRKPHWNTSSSINVRKSFQQRPSSAVPVGTRKSIIKKSINLNDENINTLTIATKAESNINNNQSENNVNKSTLFLNYSRLIEIETKIKSEIENDYENAYNMLKKRPSSANNVLTTKSTINLKFDLPELVENDDNKIGQNNDNINLYDSLNIVKNDDIENDEDNNKLGDQLAYKNLIDNLLKNENDTTVNNDNDTLNPLDEKQVQVDWLSLPDEIWLKIFSYLRQVDLMNIGNSCKTFNNLYVDRALWRTISMKYKYNMKDEWLDWIGRRRPNELNIVQCSGHITLNAITNMFKNIGDELTTLNLSRCSNEYLSGDNFALQASIRCKNVTCLDLSWTLLSNQTLKLIADSFLSSLLKRIESINLSGCNMIQEDGFNFLLTKHGEALKNLEISGCLHFSSNCILNIGVYCRGLEKLNISNCHRMTNESILEACPHWVKLKHLDLRGIKSVKNNCISVLVRKCAHLEALALADCVHIGDTSVLEIATYKPNIKYLDLNGCKKISDNSIRSLANFCSKLEYLNIKGTSITDIGLVTLSNGKFIKNLIELNLSFLPVSELVVMKLLGNSSKLKSIHLYGCYNIKHIDDLKKAYGVNNNENYLTINI